jgi:Fic family protein
MKMTKIPPDMNAIIRKTKPERLFEIINSSEPEGLKPRYWHWDRLVYVSPPEGLSHEEWWLAIKLGRSRLYKTIPLLDKKGQPFKFVISDPIPEQLHLIDLGAGGAIRVPQPITNPETRDQYYVSSLIEEAITSSQLEGATTTREVAKAMIRSARKPRDHSEQMILNNFRAMQKIGEIKEQPLTKELVFQIHQIVTENAIDDPTAAGRFRREEEDICVGSPDGTVFHVPPKASELEERMAAMCDFANAKTPSYFIHPAVRSIMLHFWLAYDHPFVDGNGRTARALFYWSMLHYGFWLCEFISISHILLKAPIKYSRSYIYSETDDNDLTYFIIYQIEVMRRALDALHKYIQERSTRLKIVEQSLRGALLLNHRQRALISHALRHPRFLYTTEGHRLSHSVSWQTARNDLLELNKLGLLTIFTAKNLSYFTPPDDLEKRLTDLEITSSNATSSNGQRQQTTLF